jgi:hypothetical protein
MSTADPALGSHGAVEGKESAADTNVIARSFMRYVDTFRHLDPRATLRHLHIPFVFVDGGCARVFSTKPEIEAFVSKVMRDLASRAYARSEIEELYVHPLSDRAAVVSVARVRYAAHGGELGRLGETYTLLRDSHGEWHIAVAIVHAADRVLRAEFTSRSRRGRIS